MALTTNIVSAWNLDETSGNAADATPTGNTLTNNNTVTYVTGLIGNGANFVASSSQSLSHTDNASLSLTGAFTIAFWVKLASSPAFNQDFYLVSKYLSAGNQRSYYVEYFNMAGTFQLGVGVSGDGSSVISGYFNQTLTVGTWYFVTATYTPSTKLEIFVNASSIGSKTSSIPASIFDSTAAFYLGTTANLSGYYNGVMDIVNIWSRVLSGTEITQLYNGGAGTQYPFGVATNSGFFMAAASL